MFFHHKRKPFSKLDKVLTGLLIGSAIGSVVGATLAPQEGKKTRVWVSNLFQKVSRRYSSTSLNQALSNKKLTPAKFWRGIKLFLKGKKEN